MDYVIIATRLSQGDAQGIEKAVTQDKVALNRSDFVRTAIREKLARCPSTGAPYEFGNLRKKHD